MFYIIGSTLRAEAKYRQGIHERIFDMVSGSMDIHFDGPDLLRDSSNL